MHYKEKIYYLFYVDNIIIINVQNKMYEGVNLKQILKNV